ncbi:hypothetical protein KCP74_20030 [Salmonella enterica subsp. enterica]|nr:hypothetical protein KCP74_20030 [Salmonella enterica subsp. enterica]
MLILFSLTVFNRIDRLFSQLTGIRQSLCDASLRSAKRVRITICLPWRSRLEEEELEVGKRLAAT